MLPLRDNVPRKRSPTATWALIAANVAAFVWQLTFGLERSVFLYGLVPAELTASDTFPEASLHVFTSMFLHGGFAHVIFNLLFLRVFGPALENRVGTAMFLVLYIGTGVVAALTQVAMGPGTEIPMVGASGAIAGALGAYFVLFPAAQVLALIPIFIFIRLVWVPAWLFLGLWFLIQVLSAPSGGGVAWGAHIGGFIAGAGIGWLWKRRQRRRYYHSAWRRID